MSDLLDGAIKFDELDQWASLPNFTFEDTEYFPKYPVDEEKYQSGVKNHDLLLPMWAISAQQPSKEYVETLLAYDMLSIVAY